MVWWTIAEAGKLLCGDGRDRLRDVVGRLTCIEVILAESPLHTRLTNGNAPSEPCLPSRAYFFSPLLLIPSVGSRLFSICEDVLII